MVISSGFFVLHLIFVTVIIADFTGKGEYNISYIGYLLWLIGKLTMKNKGYVCGMNKKFRDANATAYRKNKEER